MQEGSTSSPLTRTPLQLEPNGRLRLFPNIALRKRIEEYEPEVERAAERAAALAERRVREQLQPHGGAAAGDGTRSAKMARRA